MPGYLLDALGGTGAVRPGCGNEDVSHGASSGDLADLEPWVLGGVEATAMLIDMSPPGGIKADSRVGLVYSIVRDMTPGSVYSVCPCWPNNATGGMLFGGERGVAPVSMFVRGYMRYV